jgi:hypothetical protein
MSDSNIRLGSIALVEIGAYWSAAARENIAYTGIQCRYCFDTVPVLVEPPISVNREG